MHRKILINLAAILILSSNTLAQEPLEDVDMVPDRLVSGIADCVASTAEDADALECFAADSVPPRARSFAVDLADQSQLGLLGILTNAIAVGPITVASAVFPRVSQERRQTVILARTPTIAPLVELVFAPDPPPTRSTRSILARYPEAAESNRPAIVAYRVLPNGGQRFVVADQVTNGCSDCTVVGTAYVYLDFLAGVIANIERLGWFDPSPGPAEIVQGLEMGDIALLQQRLIASGYPAGPVDGLMGPLTRAALYALKRELCLAEDQLMLPVIPALSSNDSLLLSMPCSPAVQARPIPSRITD